MTWFYCFYSPSVLPRSILCVATPVRLDTAREECVNVLQCRGVQGGGKGTNLTDFLLCSNKPVSVFDFRYNRYGLAWSSRKYDFRLSLHLPFAIFELKLEDTSARQNKIKAGFVLLCSCLYVSLSLWRQDSVRHGQVGNVISVCLCSHLSLSLHKRERVFSISLGKNRT